MESINGPSAEETAPSTVIELTVDELAPKSPDSASSSTITSSPLEAADGRGPAAITVSNILARAEEEEQKLVQESSEAAASERKGTEDTTTQENNEDGHIEETNKQEPVPETSTDKHTDNLQTSVSNQVETDDTKAVEVVSETAATSASDDAKTPVSDDEKPGSDPDKGEASPSMTDDSLNEADTELTVVSEEKDKTDQTSPETEACLENSVLGGASVFNEDLVDVSAASDQIHPSDVDDSQEESSYVSAATGEEEEVDKKEEDEHEDNEGKENDREGQETKTDDEKDEKQEVGAQEKTAESETQEVSGSESHTPSAETPEQSVTEPPKEEVKEEQSSTITETTTADQQPSETTLPSTAAQEVAAALDSISPSQPTETTTTTEDQSSSADSSAAASAAPEPGTQKSADSVSKTKEIKIARLDVSNVALDTERLELKETSSTVRFYFLYFLSLKNCVL